MTPDAELSRDDLAMLERAAPHVGHPPRERKYVAPPGIGGFCKGDTCVREAGEDGWCSECRKKRKVRR